MLGAVRGAGRVGQEEAVHLDQAESATVDLGGDVGLHRVIQRQFGHHDAVEALQILQRDLEEGELIALVVLGDGETEHRLRCRAVGGKQFDPQIDIAVGLRPGAIGAVQPVWLILLRRNARKDSGHGSPCGDRHLRLASSPGSLPGEPLLPTPRYAEVGTLLGAQ